MYEYGYALTLPALFNKTPLISTFNHILCNKHSTFMNINFQLQLSIKYFFSLLLILHIKSLNAQENETILRQGDVVKKSIIVKKGTYYFPGSNPLTPALTIEGDNITIDFNGAVLIGNKNVKEPDSFTGIGISIKKGTNIIIKNAIIKGYKVATLARNVDDLQIINCDFSYNYRQRLKSGRFKEDASDWQSYHHNDKDEWLRFGAGIYLADCKNAIIRNNIITNGQCGLMMTRCMNVQAYNNNFSFNSGIGIGMYQSNENYILYNKIDWNVRGYSYGYYYRGQDSGGILVFDQCNKNVFAYNSATHSGDGFFLWAGQKTIDENIGGCNDNLIYGNNFSYAPTNAVEITFSRNKVIKNKLHGCWHGIWGGFSYNTVIVKNDFSGNLAGISIEHGQDNIIEQNSFTADSLAIELWAIPNRRSDFGLMNKKDTRSRNYSITHNVFKNTPTVFSIKNTQSVTIADNKYSGYKTLQKTDSLVKDLNFTTGKQLYDYSPDSIYISTLLPGIIKQDAFLPADHPQGKKSIMMTEWGPYNFKYPLLWWTDTDESGKMNFEIMGPKGSWKVIKMQGVELLSPNKGNVPDKFQVERKTSTNNFILIELEYTGEKIISPFGEEIAAGKPFRFEYRETSLPMDWEVSWFRFDSTSDPVKEPAAFDTLMKSVPIKTVIVNSLDYDRVKGQTKNLPRSKFATLVKTEVDAPKGKYRLGITAGEIVRVFVDDKLVIDSWDPSAIIFDADYYKEAILHLNGKHKIRVEKAQYGTYGMLNLTVKKID